MARTRGSQHEAGFATVSANSEVAAVNYELRVSNTLGASPHAKSNRAFQALKGTSRWVRRGQRRRHQRRRMHCSFRHGRSRPWGVERAYLNTLNQAGVIGRGQEQEALTLGYLTCALRQAGSAPVSGTEVFLGAARLQGLCDYTAAPASISHGTMCPRSGSLSGKCSLALGTLENTPGIGGNPSAADGVVDQPMLP